MSAGPIIEVAELRKEFRTRRGPVTAVAGVNFQVAAGAFVGYAGPNGAGKSTTIKMMSGLLVPTSGRVVVDGLVPSRERRRLARRIGVVFGQRTRILATAHSRWTVARVTAAQPPYSLARRVLRPPLRPVPTPPDTAPHRSPPAPTTRRCRSRLTRESRLPAPKSRTGAGTG